jgi:hypothetical protein
MTSTHPTHDKEYLPQTITNIPLTSKQRIWHRFSGKGRRKVGWKESAKAIFFVSCKPIKRFRLCHHGFL